MATDPLDQGYGETKPEWEPRCVEEWNNRSGNCPKPGPNGLDVEAMIAACLPGGSICDPQQVADAIRGYFAHGVEPQPVAVVGSDYTLLWAGGDAISDIVKRHGLRVGSKLYAHPLGVPATAKCGYPQQSCERACNQHPEGFCGLADELRRNGVKTSEGGRDAG